MIHRMPVGTSLVHDCQTATASSSCQRAAAVCRHCHCQLERLQSACCDPQPLRNVCPASCRPASRQCCRTQPPTCGWGRCAGCPGCRHVGCRGWCPAAAQAAARLAGPGRPETAGWWRRFPAQALSWPQACHQARGRCNVGHLSARPAAATTAAITGSSRRQQQLTR